MKNQEKEFYSLRKGWYYSRDIIKHLPFAFPPIATLFYHELLKFKQNPAIELSASEIVGNCILLIRDISDPVITVNIADTQ